jgi:pyridoxal phosphate enzyme (YggS family)
VALIAVSKGQPAPRLREAYDAGQRAFGENYVSEALAKMDALDAALPGNGIEWHMIGPLQSNKTRSVAERFDWVQSVDRERVARRLSAQRPAARPPLQVLIQVNSSGESSKSGVAPSQAPALARLVAGLPGLSLRGFMTVPEPTDDAALLRSRFAQVRGLLEELRREGMALDTLSMGMSGDLDAAIAEGATMVRVGTAIFGARAGKEAR